MPQLPPNSVLKRLGLSASDRLVLFHANGVGTYHAQNSAFADLLDGGLVASASVMTPAPWFGEVAAFCRDNQSRHPELDMGVHLTLTCESTKYRWGPISTSAVESGLMDEEGYFPRQCSHLVGKAAAAAVQSEIQAQLRRALAAGIDVTHIDSHRGVLLHGKFIDGYVKLALQHGIAPLLLRRSKKTHGQQNGTGGQAGPTGRQVAAWEERGLATFDCIATTTHLPPENRLGAVRELLEGLPAGLSYIAVHPAVDTPETRAIGPNWRQEVADYELCMDPFLRLYIKESGIQMISWRQLRQLQRQRN
ncbi:MAG: ChbG/HpnK family deacetylase [Candidatus Latescibacteria bacterium]|nr:ChbG/HpnK family deacetylase [Candidatus Latescibacterota bacterium]